MSNSYYAKGKILLTSEYVVLNGAKALAIPLKLGQSLTCIPKMESGVLNWMAFNAGEIWFEASIRLKDRSIIHSTSEAKAQHLLILLNKCLELRPAFLDELTEWDVRTELEFNSEYGFGSSSTLISLLAQWSGIDPMRLYFQVSTGSGYDLACAMADSAIVYQLNEGKAEIRPAAYAPSFAENLWLVYLGRKQRSEESVSAYLHHTNSDKLDINYFSTLTEDVLKCETMDDFGKLIRAHEQALSKIIRMAPLSDLYKDFNGYTKSLGAWGGDFALFASSREKEYVVDYLGRKGLSTFFPFKELVVS